MILVSAVCGLLGGLALFVVQKKIIKRIRKRTRKNLNACWSIGYRRLMHPLQCDITEDILTYNKFQISQATETIADPFLIPDNNNSIYLFHEIVFQGETLGKIAVSVFHPDKNRWEYKGVVIDEPFHLSYPYVFYTHGSYYMIPESKAARSVRLYTAIEFPMHWELVKPLIPDRKLVDPSIISSQGKHYLFANRKKRLYLYYASNLLGNWTLHPKSPVRWGNYSRCAGRIFEHHGELFRPAQELSKGYGNSMRMFKIQKLSEREYKEIPVGDGDFLHPFGNSWARFGMHHYDVLKIAENEYLAVFDGKGLPRTESVL